MKTDKAGHGILGSLVDGKNYLG